MARRRLLPPGMGRPGSGLGVTMGRTPGGVRLPRAPPGCPFRRGAVIARRTPSRADGSRGMSINRAESPKDREGCPVPPGSWAMKRACIAGPWPWLCEGSRRLLGPSRWLCEGSRRLLGPSRWLCEESRRLLGPSRWLCEGSRRLLGPSR